MAIPGIQTSAAAPQTQPKDPLTQQTVTQDDFLKLLIAQLQNQDPLNPMDNQEFAAQLATFNSLGQLISINDKLGGMQNAQAAAEQFNAASLIGKEITSAGSTMSLASGGTAKMGYQLGANASRVVIGIHDGAGKLVRQIEAGAQSAGEKSLTWDGRDSSGRPLAAGLYNFEVSAFDARGKAVAAGTRMKGVVTGVHFESGEPVLQIGDIDVPLSSVTNVRAASL